MAEISGLCIRCFVVKICSKRDLPKLQTLVSGWYRIGPEHERRPPPKPFDSGPAKPEGSNRDHHGLHPTKRCNRSGSYNKVAWLTQLVD